MVRRPRPRLGEEDKAITGPELRALVGHLANLATRERRRGARRGPRRRDRLLVELAALTGLRASELAGLEVRDVHLARRRSYLRVRHGKARSSRDIDTVPIPWELVAELEGWLEGRGRGAPVFPAATSSRAMTRGEVWLAVKRGIRACGLREVLTVHSLRHYYISEVARNPEASVLTVASLARLRSVRLVETYYHSALVDRQRIAGSLKRPSRAARVSAPRERGDGGS